jgi:salicylate hydroxylase
MSGKQDLEFAIIGGGIGGLTLGLALLHRGINVTIYEAAHHFGEIGAGVSFTPNAIRSMKICHPEIEAAFQHVRTRNAWPSKQTSWFEIYDGADKTNTKVSTYKYLIQSSLGQNGKV